MAVSISIGTDLFHQKMDLHTHTNYSDGRDTPEEMIRAAIALGLETIGLSDHSYMSFDESWCIPKSCIEAYRAEIRSLAEKYKGQIRVLTGMEQDFYSDIPASGL